MAGSLRRDHSHRLEVNRQQVEPQCPGLHRQQALRKSQALQQRVHERGGDFNARKTGDLHNEFRLFWLTTG